MASSKIKGITIEIGGDTSKLQKSLNAVNAPINKINKELNDLNKALKLDPKNTELLAQKQEVLSRNIAASKDKLVQLKEAQRQMGSYSKLTDEQKAVYNRLSLEISKTESAIKGMNEELKNTNKIDLTAVKEGLKKVGDVALTTAKALAGAITAASVAVAKIVSDGVKSYANLEKAQEGSKRLFGNSFATVEKSAKEAYKSMGISATEYYDQVNTYAVGLKESLGGDAEKAAELANDILVAQADIVAATGANTDAVQNAFAAVMRGNFTLIDNLRLGIKGSQQGMQEVINKVNEWNREQGNATNYQMGNYADMQKALVDYTKMVGVAGTASTQMSKTIQGSLSQMKAAFDNFLNGSGGAKELTQTVKTFSKNIFVAIKKVAPEIIRGLVELLNELTPDIMAMLQELLPIVIQGAQTLIEGLINFINKDSSQFIKMAISILKNVVDFILKNLPILLEASIKIISELAIGIAEAAPSLIPAIVECILLIVKTLIDNSDLIMESGIRLIFALIQGIINSIPTLLSKIPDIISKMYNKFKENLVKFFEIGKQIIQGIAKGMETEWTILKTTWSGTTGGPIEGLIRYIKLRLGIASPSKLMRDEVGKNIGLGVALGISDTVPEVEKAMNSLATGVEASVNPTINPTANSNPLYVNIDKFYNNRETDIQQLAEELEFYRKNSALAKGGA